MLPNPYKTRGPEADDAAALIAELYAGEENMLAHILLQPNPRLYMADYLDWLAGETEGPLEEVERLHRAVTTLRAVGS